MCVCVCVCVFQLQCVCGEVAYHQPHHVHVCVWCVVSVCVGRGGGGGVLIGGG